MSQPQYTGLKRLTKAFGYSMQGFAACYRHEAAFRQELMASVIIVPLGLWLGQTGVERALLVSSWLLVLFMELLNSAVEAVVDRIGPEQHELSGRAKDVASSAVLLAIFMAGMVWLLVLFGRG